MRICIHETNADLKHSDSSIYFIESNEGSESIKCVRELQYFRVQKPCSGPKDPKWSDYTYELEDLIITEVRVRGHSLGSSTREFEFEYTSSPSSQLGSSTQGTFESEYTPSSISRSWFEYTGHVRVRVHAEFDFEYTPSLSSTSWFEYTRHVRVCPRELDSSTRIRNV
jgi:hypothetical protein